MAVKRDVNGGLDRPNVHTSTSWSEQRVREINEANLPLLIPWLPDSTSVNEVRRWLTLEGSIDQPKTISTTTGLLLRDLGVQ